MPRPRLRRRVGFEPDVTYFKPAGIPKSELEETVISIDESEAVRLKDVESLGQEEAAIKMGISQPTFHRLLQSARTKIADAIVNGKAIRIEGGNFKIVGRRGVQERMRMGEMRGMVERRGIIERRGMMDKRGIGKGRGLREGKGEGRGRRRFL